MRERKKLKKWKNMANALFVAFVEKLRQRRLDHGTPQPLLDFICGSEAGTSAKCSLRAVMNFPSIPVLRLTLSMMLRAHE